MRSLSLSLAFITCWGLSFGSAADFSGSVIPVLDGNTIEFSHNQHPERIRLHGNDCPEKSQAYGQKAKHAASDLAFKQEVTLHSHGKEKYGGIIVDVLLVSGHGDSRVVGISSLVGNA